MPNDEDRSLIPLPDSSLGNTAAGAGRKMSAMVEETLVLARQEAAARTNRFKIGDHVCCEPDYHQILLWAETLKIEPVTVIERLLYDGTFFSIRVPSFPGEWHSTRFENGRIETLYWDRRLLPLREFRWVEGLQITALQFSFAYETAWKVSGLPLPLPHLRLLCCLGLGLTELDLSNVPNLTALSCEENQLTELDLSHVPNLTGLWCNNNQLTELDLSHATDLAELYCDRNRLTQLDLSQVPNLTTLWCGASQLAELDLSKVPNLTDLRCNENKIAELDIRPLLSLEELNYDADRTRLIQRPDQNF